ncbi:hypothetical protein ACQE3E_15505 [Methylomonas sp. MED-D]|uniref:hypothetical protein n=1 Tax=unclassified Methylomonas TaxID=2608980 RepID=UPI003CFF30F2
MNKYFVGQNASLKVLASGDGGLDLVVTKQDGDLRLALTLDVALALSEAINFKVEELSRRNCHD